MIYTLRMNGFLRRLLHYDQVDTLLDIAQQQREVIEILSAQLQQKDLENTRNVRNLVEQFLVVQSEGVDVRDDLIQGLRDLNDQVARLEEHSGV